MSNITAPRIMAGVTAGYVLGRMHKLKLALIVGSALANRKLVSAQVDKLTDAAGVGPLGEQLVSAGRKAALGAISSRIDGISDRIAERTDRLNGSAVDEDEDEPEDEYEDEEPAEDEEEPEDEYEDEELAEDEEEEPVAEDEEFEDEEPAEDEESPRGRVRGRRAGRGRRARRGRRGRARSRGRRVRGRGRVRGGRTMSAKESGGLLDQLPIDRLRTEVTELGKAMAKNGFSSAIEKVGDASGPAGKAAKSIKDGESPVKAATKAGTSALKDKVKEAVGGGGGGKKMKVVNILETIDVPVPRRVAYDKWTQFQDIPDFTRKVEKVDQKEDEKLEWKAQVFLSHRTWQATIKEQVPDERIVWESSGEKGHVDGAVTFHELAPDLTRVLMTLEYHPQGFFEKTANLWRAQGRRARADMRQFRREMTMHTMLEQEEQEGWRGEIRDKEVVKSDEEGQKEEKQQEKKQSSSSDGRSTSKKSASGNGNARKSTAKKSTAKKSSSSSSGPRKSAAKKSSSSSAPPEVRGQEVEQQQSSSRRSPAKKTAAARKSTGKKTASGRTAKKSASKRTAKKASRSSS